MRLQSAKMVHPTDNSYDIIAVDTISRVSLKTLALKLTHQNAQKMFASSKHLL